MGCNFKKPFTTQDEYLKKFDLYISLDTYLPENVTLVRDLMIKNKVRDIAWQKEVNYDIFKRKDSTSSKVIVDFENGDTYALSGYSIIERIQRSWNGKNDHGIKKQSI